MIINPNDIVKIKLKNGKFANAKVLQVGDFSEFDLYWWVEYKDENNQKDVTVVKESDIISWNNAKCTCGAVATYKPNNPPGHAFHCEMS